MKKITETLWIDDSSGLAVVQPAGRTDWVILNKNSAVVHGPDNFGNCRQYIEKRNQYVA